MAKDWFKVAATMVELGETLELKGEEIEALMLYIQILMIDSKYHRKEFGFSEWINSDIGNLGRMLKVLGESKFEAVWREVTGEECPEELRSEIQAAREETEK